MGKSKRKFNWKARKIVEPETKKDWETPEVELQQPIGGGIDSSNALVLPSKKDKKDTKIDEVKLVKRLSKKKRKQLQKVIERRKKKEERATLLASLQEVQASKEEMALFSSTSKIGQQLKAPKRSFDFDKEVKLSSISGSNKKRKIEDEKDKSEESDIDTSDISTDDEGEDEGKAEISKQDEKEEKTTNELNSQLSNTDVEKVDETSKDKVSPACSDGKQSPHEKEEIQQNKDDKVDKEPAVFVPVNRIPEVQEARLALPILAEEQTVMEHIKHHPVVIICGETGSGKTTQVPQFLYEAGYAKKGLIGITEPRRVAAISMSKRVAYEMNLSTRKISYQIRYEGNVSEDTEIKFVTDGVLLKEIQKDFLLSSYSVIIIDEAHERSVYTDILIGLLSRIVPLRNKKGNPLKLIIMSATLRVEDFTQNERLFKTKPPVLKVESRQYPVTVHFNKRTPVDDYMNETYKKVLKIHRTLPPGGILVFVTGQNEVNSLSRKLRAATKPRRLHTQLQGDADSEEEIKSFKKNKSLKLPKVQLDSYSTNPYEEEEADEGTINDDVDDDVIDDIQSEHGIHAVESSDDEMDEKLSAEVDDVPLYVLPLYSLLAPDKQAKVFQPPPDGTRLCVVATNVAETSLTIPGIKYVVDTGKVKRRYYDKVTGVSAFRITWTSQASSNQRAGRAGRTEAGHCYRLYSSAVFANDFEKFSPPEITRRPVDDLILQMKDMNIDKVVNFPFPTPPEVDTMKAAEKLLISLGALAEPPKKGRLKDIQKAEFTTSITPLGKAMACFPVAPRYAKMLALGKQEDCLQYTIAIVSALTVHDLFEEFDQTPASQDHKEEQRKLKARISHYKRMWAGQGESLLLGDLMVLLSAVGASEFGGMSAAFCGSHGMRYKAMVEIRRLRRQLTNAVNAVDSECGLFVDPNMKPPTLLQIKLLRQIALAGMADHVARRLPSDEQSKDTKNAYKAEGLEDLVYIHPNSILFKQLPEYIIYQEIIETGKLYMRGVSAIEPDWLPRLLPHMCTFSKPLDEPSPSYHSNSGTVRCYMTSTFGRNAWTIPAVELEYPTSLEKYKWFATFLLDGKVIATLGEYVPYLLSSPRTMVKSWAKLQPRTEVFLNALIRERVDSKKQLLQAWEKDDKYLLSEYCEWLAESKHSEIMAVWPPAKRKD
ncbi:probable ATP-dependent RNA helicase DHX37 [Ptychodera flava]|uniref:probable ATP-dependent RNA helicase DHX37 n=1 Tax=Ptychodera flava TaxID=63121 RepID=UPI003969E783